MSRPLIWLPMRSQYWAANGVELLADSDMELLTVTPPWIVNNPGNISKDADVRPGSPGVRSLKISFNGTNFPGVYQVVLTVARRYWTQGWLKGTSPIVYNTPQVIFVPGTVPWTQVSTSFTATAATFQFQGPAGASDQWFDDWTLQEEFMYTQNIGSAGNVQCGDGRTAATFPVMLTPAISLRRGMVFSGVAGVDLRCTTALPSLTSVTAVVQFFGLEKTANYLSLFGKNVTATNGWALNADLSGTTRVASFYCRGWGQYVTAPSGDIADGGLHTVVGTYDAATGIASAYVDGLLVASAAKVSALDGGADNNTYLASGAWSNAKMKTTHASAWSFAMTGQQVRLFTSRLMAEIST